MTPRTTAVFFASLLVACGGGRGTEPATTGTETPAVDAVDEPETTPAAAGACTPTDPSTWAACDGQEHTVEGTAATMVYNHPLVGGSAPGEESAAREIYMNVGDAQIIVVTTDTTECEGAMSVHGTLSYIDLGGEPGTMGSYRGLAVQGAAVTCK